MSTVPQIPPWIYRRVSWWLASTADLHCLAFHQGVGVPGEYNPPTNLRKIRNTRMNYCNKTRSSPIKPVIIRVIHKISRPRSGSPTLLIKSNITDRFGKQKVLITINHKHDKFETQNTHQWSVVINKNITVNLSPRKNEPISLNKHVER